MKAALIILLSGMMLSGGVVAADAKRGAELAQARCLACHSDMMVKVVKFYPSLNGQKSAYIFKQLVDIRDGNRIAPIMKPMIAGLSEQDFKDLAAYFESLKPSRLADK